MHNYDKLMENDSISLHGGSSSSTSEYQTPVPQATLSDRVLRLRNHLTKKQIRQFIYKWRWTLFFIINTIVSIILMLTFRRQFFQALETFSHKLREMGYGGYILISLLIITSAFPPIFGYSIYLTLSGYSFGFSAGFPIAYFSALGGASACFWLSRTIFKQKVIRILARYPSMQAVIRAVEKKGFKLFTLIRLSPYPFNLLNFLFAATDIPFSHFVAGTALSLLKIALHIYIGANLTSFAKHILGEDGDEDMTEEQKTAEKIKFAAGIVGSIISFAVIAYVYKLAKEAIAEVKLEEDEEMQGFLNEEESMEVDDDNDH